jgi:hypothetical protein
LPDDIVSPALRLYLFDSFEGFDARDVNAESQNLPVEVQAFNDTSLTAVKDFVGSDADVVYCQGCAGFERALPLHTLIAILERR